MLAKLKITGRRNLKHTPVRDLILDSERSDECIDFTMIITSRNNASISNFGDGFRWQNEYPWSIIEVKSKHSPTVFKKIEKNKKKKMMEKRKFLRKTSFRPNRFFYMVLIQKSIIFSKAPGKTKKKIKEKREFLRKTSFRLNRFFYMVVIQKLITLFIDH
ncbi:Uncharacterized protein FWK35_00019262 [Aphis craccivora]|uniref:Uncharacterized protein n=1 Tax=Aphis craccivora TaxID=307492 RepID=A0A6G0Z8Y5_APHCR|nr:Uncharacterized protein FWK35_00019262 [Aphis craccivora]